MTRYASAAVLLLCAGLAYGGCDAIPSNGQLPVEMAMADLPPGLLALPSGSEVWTDVEDAGSTLWFRLPETHALMGQVREGDDVTVHQVPGGGITCTCTDGSGGCSPFRAVAGGKEWVGCAMDPDRCSSCEISTSALVLEGQPGVRLEEVIVVDRTRPIKLVETYEEADRLQCGSATLLHDPATVQAIADYVRPFQGQDLAYVLNADPDDLDDDVVTAPIDVYGHVLWVPVRLEWIETTDAAEDWPTSELMWDRYVTAYDETGAEVARAVPGDGSCMCSAGGGGCTYERLGNRLVGYVEFCDAQGCNSCTLFP